MDVAVDQVFSPLLLLLLLLAAVVSFSASAQDTNVTFPLPSNCPTSCGNITFQYPFGIGHGCFRPGFDLTCNTTTNPPKLFLANASDAVIFDIDPGQDRDVVIKAPVAIIGVKDNSSYMSWTTPANRPYRVSSSNIFWVVGCNADASLVDLTTNITVATCSTTCSAAESPDPGTFDFNQETCRATGGCCYAQLPDSVLIKSYGIKLSRRNHAANATVVKSLVAYESNSTVPVTYLRWIVNDGLSCLSYNSERRGDIVNSQNVGYYCTCLTDHGNPYVPDGCYDPTSTVLPSNHCATKQCGNISIPFPFGLKEGCYKDAWFALTCNESSKPPTLLFNLSDSYGGQVDKIKVEESQIEISSIINSDFYTGSSKPFGLLQERAIYGWVIEYTTCELAMQSTSNFACRSNNSVCVNRNITFDFYNERTGYFCKCFDGFEGNPYLPDGCKDIDECHDKEKYVCHGDCVNTVGNYSCTCPPGTFGDPTKEGCISHKKQIALGVIVAVCVGFGTPFLAVASCFGTWKWKKINQKRIRRRNFSQNHGLLLQQLIASNEDVAERTKIFSLEDLEKATNNFDSLRILGHGGHGMVYKGILADQRIVAIKKSKIIVKKEIDEFINEVTILSHINHRNVVKLFGCCLETEVPLLVYEFISNGTLFDHLHRADHKSTLAWKERLRIASEVAGALAYLHSSASISIFHRDMKSSNILLDEYFTAKVSDFGASKFIPLDETHIFTAIQGTFGYLDPEYYQTCELTAKSDVYSFGVILLELLTGKKPISSVRNEEERNLVMRFLHAIRENRQFELMETRVMEEASREELDHIGKLAELCLRLKGNERPTMKEVEMKLRFLLKAGSQRSEKRITEVDQEIIPLLSVISSYDLPSGLVAISSSQDTRNYSLEREWMDSFIHLR